MRKIIFSSLVATILFISSCEKKDNGGGGSGTSLYGDWYESVYYNDPNDKGMRWLIPIACARKTIWSISDKKIKYERYSGNNINDCNYTPTYYDYTTSNGVFNMTISDDSPYGTKGNTASIKYEMKNKELIFHYRSGKNDVINVLRKKGVDYSHLDPFIGCWEMTKATVGKTEHIVKQGECLYSSVVASYLGFTLYLNYPDKNGQCQKTINNYQWVNEGGKYYNVSNPQEKVFLDINFSDNNHSMTYSGDTQFGKTIMYFTKIR